MTAPTRPSYRDANVVRWLVAHTAAITGDVVYFLALTWTATEMAGPFGAGLIIAIGALPRAVLLLGGGVLVDRFGPRRVAIASDATRCCVILGAAVVVLVLPTQVWFLAVVALVFGVVDAVFMPAVGAFPPRLAQAGELVRVQGMRGLSLRLSNTVGPLLGGVMLTVGGAGAGFATAGVLFAASLVLLLAVRIRPHDNGSGRHGLREGWRYIRAHRALLPLITVIGLSEMCFSGPVAAGLVLLADERGWGAGGVAWIAGAFSVGGAAAAFLLTVRAHLPRAGLTIYVALLTTAATTTLLGFADGLAAAAVLGAATGLASGITMTVTSALVQTVVHPDYLGRVTAVTTLFTLGLAPALFPAVGFVVDRWGAATFFAGCGALCLLAATVALVSRAGNQATD